MKIPNLTHPSRWSLATRLAVLMTLVVMLTVASVTAVSIIREQESFRDEMEQQAALLLNNLRISSSDALYLLNVDLLAQLVRNTSRAQAGTSAQIYDASGRVIVDSEITNTYAFSLETSPFGVQVVSAGDIVYNWQPETLQAGIPVTIGREVIGAVSITLPTDSLTAKTRAALNQGRLSALVAALVGALLSWVVSRTVTNPLRELTEATRRIAGGELDYKINVKSGGELGELADSFNKMTVRLEDLVGRLTERATELQRANDRAREASRLKSEFLATMSHELRTPLNAIIGFSDMLLMGMSGPLTEPQQHKVTRLQENGKRLLNLVNDVLDIARIEAGRAELVSEEFRPRIMAERVSEQMAVLAENKGLKFTTTIDPNLPPILVGDEKRLEQIIVNLISNAVKFTDTGEVKLAISAFTEVKAWEIVVEDTGVGIPPHALDVIFEEFRQVDGTSTRAYKGTGLGLAITRHLVTMMRGQIKVESELGVGSRFMVMLPMTHPASETQHHTEMARG